MLKPSINEVLDKIDNRYYLVGTVAKRAREIIDGAEVYVSAKNRDNNKPVTIATQEVADEKITFRLLTQEEIDKKDWPVDYIAVDAIYTPIRKVSYEIQDTMFGRMTDFDKLTLNVETDGSIEIRDAISYAVELLKLHLDPFLEIGNKMENLRDDIEEMIDEPMDIQVIDDKSHDMKIEELDLTVRSFNCLKKAGIEEVSQLASLSLNELLKIKNLGKKSLDEILEKMKDLGYDLEKNGSPE